MQVQVEKSRALIPAGEHTLTLREITPKTVQSRFAKSPDGTKEKLLFRFESSQSDEDGEPFEYAVWTGLAYGNEKAALTGLLDQLVPDMNKEKAKTLDLDGLLHKKYRTVIKHRKDDAAGKTYAYHTLLEPVNKPAPATVQTAPATDVHDPFADD